MAQTRCTRRDAASAPPVGCSRRFPHRFLVRVPALEPGGLPAAFGRQGCRRQRRHSRRASPATKSSAGVWRATRNIHRPDETFCKRSATIRAANATAAPLTARDVRRVTGAGPHGLRPVPLRPHSLVTAKQHLDRPADTASAVVAASDRASGVGRTPNEGERAFRSSAGSRIGRTPERRLPEGR